MPVPGRPRRPGTARRLAVATSLLAALALAGCGADGTETPRADGARPAVEVPVPEQSFPAVVRRVVDGDTFVADRDGREVRVRLIGIDAPESVRPDSPVDCYGRRASAELEALLPEGEQVRAAHQGDTRQDRFGRDLWDVWLPDGRFVQGELVARGSARARVYRPHTRYAGRLAETEATARAARRGLWGACDT